MFRIAPFSGQIDELFPLKFHPFEVITQVKTFVPNFTWASVSSARRRTAASGRQPSFLTFAFHLYLKLVIPEPKVSPSWNKNFSTPVVWLHMETKMDNFTGPEDSSLGVLVLEIRRNEILFLQQGRLEGSSGAEWNMKHDAPDHSKFRKLQENPKG